MLNRIVAITFVALLYLALAGQSIAETKKLKQQENQEQLEAMKTFQKALQGANQVKVNPTPDAGPNGVPSGTTSAPPASRQ